MDKSKWFRVAVEGATTDGRTIAREWISQMAKNYSPTKYGARVNLEHIRGVLPDGPFNAYGDVLALEARDETGEFAGKLGLYAQISPTPALVAMTKDRQKIYTSCEVDPAFADTKQAYLIGLAVTDSPASLGTEMLAFAAGLGERNPLASRKQSPQNVFSAAHETVIELEPDASAASEANGNGAALFSRVAELLGIVKKKGTTDDGRFADMTQAVEALANHGRAQAGQFEALSVSVRTLTAELDVQKRAREATDTALAELTAKLSQEAGGAQRPAATGTPQNGAITTDC